MTYTDDEVRESVQKIDCNSADYPVHKSEQWKVAMWAAEQYLAMKGVIRDGLPDLTGKSKITNGVKIIT